MSRLFEAYRACHEQGFLPIFTDDHFDSRMLVESCLEAGVKGIEYTLRRKDAHKMIPWIKENYPELYLLVGSTLDSDSIVVRQKRKHPQLLTLSELDAMDVDGFVSMIGWSEESIRKYSPRRLVMPTAMTVREALLQVNAGAHFAKMLGSDLDFVRRCRASAAFDYCPILVTGGMSTGRIPDAVEAGAVLVGAGFDLTLKGEPKNVSPKKVVEVMKQYLEVTRTAREKVWSEMVFAIGGERQTWLDSLPHYHPF